MKYCYHCGHITPGEPLFCNSCGRTYDVKLCSGRHPNVRSAEVCSQCGSRDLSTPQPRVPVWTRAFVFLMKVVLAVLFAYLGLLFLIVLLKGIVASQQAINVLLSLAIFGGLLCWLWNQLPQWVRKIVTRMVGRKGERHGR